MIIDGVPQDEHTASLSVFDWAVIRGFGVFEVVRSYRGTPFRLDRHLDRLEHSASALGIVMPGHTQLAADVARVARDLDDGQVRIVLTGGGRDHSVVAPPHTIVMGEPLPVLPDRVRVLPVAAPWHPATSDGGFPGVKWLSYAPNMATTDRVRALGYDDALLLSPQGLVLEGPTFSYAWVRDGVVETPSLDLGILPSITREVVIECCRRLGITVVEGRFRLDHVLDADEVLAMSTVKQVTPVIQVGDAPLAGGPITERLAGAFAAVVGAETGSGSTAPSP